MIETSRVEVARRDFTKMANRGFEIVTRTVRVCFDHEAIRRARPSLPVKAVCFSFDPRMTRHYNSELR